MLLRFHLFLFQLHQFRNVGPHLIQPASNLLFCQDTGTSWERDILIGLVKFDSRVIQDLEVNEGFFPPL